MMRRRDRDSRGRGARQRDAGAGDEPRAPDRECRASGRRSADAGDTVETARPAAGITKSVTVCAGSVAARLPPETATSARRVIAFDASSCQAWAADPAAKLERFSTRAALPVRRLCTTMTVSAPSSERNAAKAESVSGSGAVARTLTSPKADLAPS